MNGERANGGSPRILVVDDEADVRQVLRTALEGRGYRVDEAASGEEALSQLASRRYDLLLLDLRMAGMNGVGMMERVHLSRPDLPIIILTGYATLESAIAAVRCGAADYLLKPVSVHEIVRAVRRALQRTGARGPDSDGPVSAPPDGPGGEILAVGPLTLNLKTGCLLVEKEGEMREIFLTSAEAAVLACLMRSPGEVVTYQALAQEVWHLSPDPGQPRDMVRVVIHRLRRKVEPDPRHPTLIQTIFGRGYLLQTHPSSADSR
jgi:DNA-binding response OmpR family regulator